MNTSLTIVTEDKLIGIGNTLISGIGTDMSWIPTNVHAVHWNGSSGEIEYNDGTPNLGITTIGIYSQAETTFTNEINRRKDLEKEYLESSSFLWMKLRSERDNLLLSSDFTQLGDIGLDDSKKTEWINYRQALRDLPANTSDPANPSWPTKPS